MTAPNSARALPMTLAASADGASCTIHRVFVALCGMPSLAPNAGDAAPNTTSTTATATALEIDIASPEIPASNPSSAAYTATLRAISPVRHEAGERTLITLRRAPVFAIAALVFALVGALPAPTLAATPALSSFSISGSPFAESFAPLPTSATLTAILSRSARVTVTIRRPGGTLMRRLTFKALRNAGPNTWAWDGHTDAGPIAPDGRYIARIVAVTASGRERIDRPLRKGLPRIYPQNPGALVIAVDPGHGGRFPGAMNGSS